MSCDQKCVRIIIVLTALFTLIQGVIYLGISVWSILIHNCFHIPNKFEFEKVLYFIYFRNGECGEVKWSKDSNQSETLPDLPEVTTIAFRTFILMIFYASISALWIITSLMVLGSFCSIVNRRAYRTCFIPWLIFILFGCTLDVIASIFFVNDIFNTETAEQTLNYLDVKNVNEMLELLKDYNFVGPSIRLVCISSRFIIFWLINLVAAIYSVHMTKILLGSKESPKISRTETDSPEFYDNHGFTHDPSAEKPGHPRKSFVPLKESAETTPERSLVDPAEVNNRHLSRQQSLLSDRKVNNSNLNGYSNLDETPSPKKHKRYQANEFEYASRIRPEFSSQHQNESKEHRAHYHRSDSQQQENYSKPHHHRYSADYRQSTQSPNESELRKPDKPHITAELRSQLPWSYFGPPSETKTPRHTLVHSEHNEDHEVLPPIPVPDYTLHFPRKDRPIMGNNNDSRPTSASPRSSYKP